MLYYGLIVVATIDYFKIGAKEVKLVKNASAKFQELMVVITTLKEAKVVKKLNFNETQSMDYSLNFKWTMAINHASLINSASFRAMFEY